MRWKYKVCYRVIQVESVLFHGSHCKCCQNSMRTGTFFLSYAWILWLWSEMRAITCLLWHGNQKTRTILISSIVFRKAKIVVEKYYKEYKHPSMETWALLPIYSLSRIARTEMYMENVFQPLPWNSDVLMNVGSPHSLSFSFLHYWYITHFGTY